ncbi:MAG: DNA repair protein RecO [Patescibacteria group bacterium]
MLSQPVKMYPTLGIIIKKQDKGENDKIVTLLTKEYGKLDLIARGVRKNKSKLASHTELFSLSEIGFVLGKGKSVLVSACEINVFVCIKSNSEKLKTADCIADLVCKYILQDNGDENIFNLVNQAFSYMNEKEFSSLEMEYFLRYFEFKFLATLGYQPQEKDITFFFSPENKVINRKKLRDIRLILSRYFKNIFNEV